MEDFQMIEAQRFSRSPVHQVCKAITDGAGTKGWGYVEQGFGKCLPNIE